MKKIFYTILFVMFSSNLFAQWDSTLASFYPLKVGNKYIYEIFGSGDRTTLTITADTIINGHVYYIFEGAILPDRWRYQRLDSNTLNVMMYNPLDSNEYLFDSLRAQTLYTDWYHGYRRNFPSGNPYRIFEQNTYFWYGAFRKLNTFNSGTLYDSYQLLEGIGLFQSNYFTWAIKMEGCVLDGVVYGDTTVTSLSQNSTEIPNKFNLNQNYPNPFNPSTNISFDIPKSAFVELKVFDITGRLIASLVNESLSPGSYNYSWNSEGLSSGVYFYTLKSESFVSTKKMLLIK